jgi:hypothetical protein
MNPLFGFLALVFAATAYAEVPAKYQEIFSKLRGVRIVVPV